MVKSESTMQTMRISAGGGTMGTHEELAPGIPGKCSLIQTRGLWAVYSLCGTLARIKEDFELRALEY